jgi:APA family basic amino acid/polyamine antiporter
LGVPTATLLVVASMVGTGVFTTTGYLLRDIGSVGAVLLAWLLGGVLALFGALAYGELVAALPHNGGEYQLLGRIYHPAVGFVAAWTSLVVGFSAPIAASAIAFGEYANAALGADAIHPAVHALALIGGLTLVHVVRITVGVGFQNVVTSLKVLLIVAFVLGGLVAGDLGRLTEGSSRTAGEVLLSSELAIGLIYVSFAYTGWNAATYIAGELRNPGRTLPVSLVLGTLAVTVLYLGLNVVFLASAPAETIAAAESRVGHVAAAGLFGGDAARVLSAIIAAGLVSTVGALIMTGPRVYEAVGRDYPRLAFLGWRREGGGPVTAMLLQSAVAAVMALTATFDELLTYIGVTLSLGAALTVIGVFVLRVREPNLERPYRAWGHPITSLVFVALMLWMVVASLIERPTIALVSLGTVLAGSSLYLFVRPRR